MNKNTNYRYENRCSYQNNTFCDGKKTRAVSVSKLFFFWKIALHWIKFPLKPFLAKKSIPDSLSWRRTQTYILFQFSAAEPKARSLLSVSHCGSRGPGGNKSYSGKSSFSPMWYLSLIAQNHQVEVGEEVLGRRGGEAPVWSNPPASSKFSVHISQPKQRSQDKRLLTFLCSYF